MIFICKSRIVALNPLKKSYKIIGAAAVSLASIMWGFDGIVLTPRLFNLNVLFVVFILHLIPFSIMNIFLFREYRQLLQFTRQDFISFLLVALFGGVVGTAAIVKALFLVNFQDLSVVVLLQKLQPVFSIALAVVILKESMRQRFALWAGLAIVSSYFLIFGFGKPDFNTGQDTLYAALYALLASFSFASSTVFSKKVLMKFSFQASTFYRYGFTTLILLVVVIVSGQFDQFPQVTKMNWLYFGIIAITTGSGAIFLYYFGLIRINAMLATMCELFFPISAILFDYFFNGKVLTGVQWAAAALMIYAIIKLNQAPQLKKS